MDKNNIIFLNFEKGVKGEKKESANAKRRFIQSCEIVKWVSEPGKNHCEKCRSMNGKLLAVEDVANYYPPHPNCRCQLKSVTAIESGTLTDKERFGIDNIFTSCDDKTKKSLISQGKIYIDSRLPEKAGRNYYLIESDSERTKLIVSDDGLCFGTTDNLKTIYPVENKEKERAKRKNKEEKFIGEFENELKKLEKGEIAPMAYSYIMKNVYDWYLTDSTAERVAIESRLKEFKATGYTKTGEKEVDEKIEYMKELPKGLLSEETHYFRNKLNIEYSWEDFVLLNARLPEGYKWYRMSAGESSLHQNTAPVGKPNKKYVSFDGYFELVYSYNGKLLDEKTAYRDMGTYNYGPSTAWRNEEISKRDAFTNHILGDITTYLIYMNNKKDNVERSKRILKKAIRNIVSR